MAQDVALEMLKTMTHELRELDLGHAIDEVQGSIDPATFLRCYVGANKPVIVRGGAAHWPALRQWSRHYLEAAAGDALVTVDVTPNGRGDAVTQLVGPGGRLQLCFCTPHQRRCTLAEFLELFYATQQQRREQHAASEACSSPAAGESSTAGGSSGAGSSGGAAGVGAASGSGRAVEVPYLSHQNSNLTQELPMLLPDVDAQLPWAAAAFGAPPDAVNLWIGDERAATTFHKDHYENLYCMVAGTKIFHLLPPSDAYRLSLTRLPIADYQPAGPSGTLVPVLRGQPGSSGSEAAQAAGSSSSGGAEGGASDGGGLCGSGGPGGSVVWSPIEPRPADPAAAAAAHPLFFAADLPPPLVATLGPGDVLYLPSLWHHFVEQRADRAGGDWVVAVNAWYDMHYGHAYAYFKLAESLAMEAGLVPRPVGEAGSSDGDSGSSSPSSSSRRSSTSGEAGG